MIKQNITKQRKLLGCSQAELARRIGMSRQRLSRLMCNEALFTIEVLDDLSNQLGCHKADLLGYDGASQSKLDKIKEVLE